MKVIGILCCFVLGFLACASGNEHVQTDIASTSSEDSLIRKQWTDTLKTLVFIDSLSQNYRNETQELLYSFQLLKEEYKDLDSSLYQIKKAWTQMHLLHLLFTSEGAYNCARGPVENIPYFWHWVSDNPRHEIRFTKDQKLLKETKAPAPFRRYNSFADIDRTPELYLSDYFAKEARYYNPCDTFYTFGWCSEREMAFVALLQCLNIESKVVAEGNHSWTEACLKVIVGNQIHYFLFQIDNTFNSIGHQLTDLENYNLWKKDLGDSKIEQWYNQKALDANAHQNISEINITPKRMQEIDDALFDYFKSL